VTGTGLKPSAPDADAPEPSGPSGPENREGTVAKGFPAGTREVLQLAWPATLSFLLNNAFRINDQFWVQRLGPDAQAAVGASTFVLIMNFALFFMAAGGALALVSHATGAGDHSKRDTIIRHSFLFAIGTGIVLSIVGASTSGTITSLLGMEGRAAEYAEVYLRTLYLGLVPMALLPVLNSVFIGLGNTRVPLLMQITSVVVNFVLNPFLIYGIWSFEGLGMAGAALATCISRTLAVALGLVLLVRAYRVHLLGRMRTSFALLGQLARVGAPTSFSIAIYAGVYWMLMAFVISKLGREVVAGGLGIGFNVFEGISFPFFLGVGVACSSLVGRNLGAGRMDLLLESVKSSRRIGGLIGVCMSGLFMIGGPLIAPLFTSDEAVLAESLLYVRVLAFSQLFVAFEVVNERVLLGSGHTRPILWISVPLNLLRIPLAWFLAIGLGWTALGVWWAINVTSLIKAVTYHFVIQSYLKKLTGSSA
jgi:putative MATE family efflux protein